MSKPRAILEAAAKRFRHYGISKTTMHEIAADAGMAVGTLYLYFSNKDALVVACAEEYAAEHRAQAEQLLAGKLPVAEKLRQYVLLRYHRAAETRTSSRHAAEITRAVLRVKPDRIQEEAAMMRAVFEQLLAQGVKEGAFQIADVKRDAEVFLFAIAAFFPSALTEPPVVTREQDVCLVIDWFLETWSGKRSVKSASRARGRLRTRD